MLLVAAISVPVMLWSPSGLARLEALQTQRETLALEVARLERDIERLRYQAESIKTSPSSIERPLSGRTMPISILIAVDLPAPLRPNSPYTLPCGTRKLSESTTRRPP